MVELSYENEDKALISRFVERGYRTTPSLWVNGSPLPPEQCSQARPNQTLLSFLRSIGLTGTKLGCGEGGCGACTVVISKSIGEKIEHRSVNACLFPVLAADGLHVTTVEGIGSWKVGTAGTTNGFATNNVVGGEDNLHPIQRAMVDMHGSQCGFCTPGIIMAMYGLFASNTEGKLDVRHLEEHLDGNLCRCTGYRPIWDAARSLCADVEDGARGPCGVPCKQCPERDICEMDCNVEKKEQECGNSNGACGDVIHCCTEKKVQEFKQVVHEKYGEWWKRPDQTFPKDLSQAAKEPLVVVDTSIHNGGTWFQPHSLEELLDLFREFALQEGGLKLVVGNTEVGIETKFKHAVYPRMVHPKESVHTLYEVVETDSHINVGACTSLSSLQSFCHDLMSNEETSKTTKPIHDMLRWFASTQIRNVACLGGNLATASPISDMNPMLAAMGANIILASRPRSDGGIERRNVPVKNFFLGYRTVDKKDIELIERVEIPLAKQFEYVAPFKQARRREDDISIVTSGMKIKLRPDESSWIVEDVSIAFGGMAPKTVMAIKTMNALNGKKFEESSFAEARSVMRDEFRMPEDVPGGQAEYRLTLACSFLYKFYLHCVTELRREVGALVDKDSFPPVPIIPSEEESAVGGFVSAQKPSTGGTQTFPTPKVAAGVEESHFSNNNNKVRKVLDSSKAPNVMDSVGKPATHASGPLHCTGEAAYADDIPAPENLLHGSLILASKCNTSFASIDITPALNIPGVFGAYTHKDIEKLGGDNRMGPILLDDVAFLPIGEKVEFVGQVLGIVVGVSQEIAEKGARAVDVQFGEEEEGTAIVTIEDAIRAQSFWTDFRQQMKRGEDVNEILSKTEIDGKKLVVVTGSFRSGGQEHFYLEPNSALVIPSESGTNLTIYASTQAPTKTQDFCAKVTNTPAARVVVRMKRMGGGFGGKETRSVFSSVAAAVAAKISNRPVRLTLNRDIDMSITGGRHAFVTYYKAGAIVHDDGSVKLHALDLKLYNNGGGKFDLTGPVMERALFHVDNCYNWPNFHSVGTPCKTFQPPHTAFRGFGGPQGMAVTEHIMDHLAIECNISGDKLRRDNMYTLQDSTPFGMRFGDGFTGKWNVPSIYDDLYNKLDVPGRRVAAAEFNAKNKWTKRGVALIPTKFGIAFTAKCMNQGGALVHLYTDGTVLVSHGGTEMGQGLHTKVCQVAAQAFGIPLDHVYVNDSSTDKVANTIPSAASMSTDLYGMATLDACKQILKRIQPIRDSLPPNATLTEVAKKAFFERVDLSAHGFYALDDDRCGYDWAKERPEGFPADQPENSWKGHPFNYFTQGVAFAEVEIDVLTGDHKTLSADVVVDVGSSINPAIDIGQIEGAFIQGMGWSTIEEVVYADDDHTWIRPRAKTFTTGPGTYKIPAFNDVPEKFNVSLMQNADNPFAVHSSKAVGEPPFFLGCSVFFAIKDAVSAARGKNAGYFEFRMPATSERIRMACNDEIASKCIVSDASTFQPKGSF